MMICENLIGVVIWLHISNIRASQISFLKTDPVSDSDKSDNFIPMEKLEKGTINILMELSIYSAS